MWENCNKAPHSFDEDGSLLAGDESRADDDVHVLRLLGKQRHLCIVELLGHLLGVPARALARLLIQRDKHKVV